MRRCMPGTLERYTCRGKQGPSVTFTEHDNTKYSLMKSALESCGLCSKHHATYVDKLNAALEPYPELQNLDLVKLNQYVGTDKIPENVTTAVRNNGAQRIACMTCDCRDHSI